MSPTIPHLRAWHWEHVIGCRQDGHPSAAASLVASESQPSRGASAAAGAESWAELHVAARAPERQMGNGCV